MSGFKACFQGPLCNLRRRAITSCYKLVKPNSASKCLLHYKWKVLKNLCASYAYKQVTEKKNHLFCKSNLIFFHILQRHQFFSYMDTDKRKWTFALPITERYISNTLHWKVHYLLGYERNGHYFIKSRKKEGFWLKLWTNGGYFE